MHTFLVVDDSAVMRKALMRDLHGVRPHSSFLEAASGDAAAAALDAHQGGIDLVFCDLTMPHGDGIAFLERRAAGGHKVPVIILTADAREDRARQAVEKGAYRVLTKPLRTDEVALVLQDLLPLPQGTA
jgi:CheY-like chemotaxis protein